MKVCDVYGFNKGLECVFKQFPKQAECSNYQEPSVIITIAVYCPHILAAQHQQSAREQILLLYINTAACLEYISVKLKDIQSSKV